MPPPFGNSLITAGGWSIRNAAIDGDDAARADIERTAARRLHAAFRAVLAAMFPDDDRRPNQEIIMFRLQGAWGAVRPELARMLTEAALLGARFARLFYRDAVQSNEATIRSAWDLINEDALQYILGDRFQMGGGYTDELAQQLLRTSERQIRQALADWTRSGDPLPALIRALESTALSPDRAEMIAVTEVTRAYAESARLTWARDGVVETMRWQTANDDDVCPICRPLNGQTTAVVGGVFLAIDAATGDTLTIPQPPAHQRCRCWLSPVVP